MPQAVKTDSPILESLLIKASLPPIFDPGVFVEGIVIYAQKKYVLVDLNGIATGIISGREAYEHAEFIAKLQPGDMVSAYVTQEENKDGLVVLSLKKAHQEKQWNTFIDAYENGTVISIKPAEANKGGLLLDIDGIKGFIPVSQLAPLHYPRVDGADPGLILQRLQALTGVELHVKIINIDKENGKLILSEKAATEDERRKTLSGLSIGQVFDGKISGIVKFGLFVAFAGLEGLVHISEIAWGHVSDPSKFGKLGDAVKVKVIGVEGDKISLSMKQLVPDPWLEAAKKFPIGTVVEGNLNRVIQFGAFLKLGDDINGLIHVSEISSVPVQDATKSLKVDDHVRAKVIAIEPADHRISLSMKVMEDEAGTARISFDGLGEGAATEPAASEEKPKKVVKKKVVKKEE